MQVDLYGKDTQLTDRLLQTNDANVNINAVLGHQISDLLGIDGTIKLLIVAGLDGDRQ